MNYFISIKLILIFLISITKCTSSCNTTVQCVNIDPNSYCSKAGYCVCDSGFTVYNGLNKLCISKRCRTATDCNSVDNHSVCVEFRCGCELNYKFNKITQLCEEYKCENSNDCSIGSNRVCDVNSGKCICGSGYLGVKSANGVKCLMRSTTYKQSCNTPYSNLICDLKFWGEVCVDHQCRCAAQYKYNIELKKCQSFNCSHSYECQTYDSNRYCISGQCLCNTGYKINKLNGNKCINADGYTYVKTYDNNRICDSDKCKCNTGYIINPSDSYKCNKCATNYRIDGSGKCVKLIGLPVIRILIALTTILIKLALIAGVNANNFINITILNYSTTV